MEDRLAKFARIIDAGSFTEAARRLRISQPALTAAVKKLERELHAELLVRTSRTFKLTPAGALAYEAAKALTAQTQNLRIQLHEVSEQKSTLKLGMIDSIASLFLLGPHLKDLGEATQLSAMVDNSTRLISMVQHDELDAALIACPESSLRGLEQQSIGKQPLVIVARPEYASLAHEELKKNQLRSFLAYNYGSQTFFMINKHFADRGIRLQPAFYSTSPEILLHLALAGQGLAVLPYDMVQQHLAHSALQAIPIQGTPLVQRSIIAIKRQGRILPHHLDTTYGYIEQALLQQQTAANRL